ncbi:MAG: hypothetical protein ACRDKV_01530 [Solirubrobacterales bacterium]
MQGSAMRKSLVLALAFAVTVGTVGIVGPASAENIQSINGKVRPKRLPKRGKRRNVAVTVNVSTTNPANPYAVPSPTTLAKVDFDKDIRIQNRGLATCNPARFTSATTTSQAKSLCRRSQVGHGSSTIAVPTGPSTPPLFVNAVVTAFNAKRRSLVLHTYNSLSGATTLIGTIRRDRDAGRKYRSTLTVPVPPLAGGTAVIAQFRAKVKKSYRHRHKRRYLISARCRGRRILFQARFTYKDGTSDTARDKARCKPKRRHR